MFFIMSGYGLAVNTYAILHKLIEITLNIFKYRPGVNPKHNKNLVAMAARVKTKKAARKAEADNPPIDTVLHEELEARFLSYALSTIVSRALPDVRDGLKPVHRRVLYSMRQLRLGHEARFRKSAAVVGEVIGKYHPHGDQAVYDTMVRLAQDFSLRYPLVHGQGNFGNVDGDPAAAMRYTEARLTAIAEELLEELNKETVEFAPTYDDTQVEPRVLPARFPNLLVNGSSGIAVGLATNIPPHNLKETIDAAVAMIGDPKIEVSGLLKHVKGPDFPTGGQLIASKAHLRQVYEAGKGSLKIRGEWTTENLGRGKWQIIITSIPYSVNKSSLIEKIADLIISKKIPALVDVRDESTEEIRIVLEPKSQTVEADKVMNFVYRHTDLQINFPVNLTALTPQSRPLRHSLRDMLRSFLDFRYEVTEKRLSYDLRKIEERLHILKALAKVYNDLDAAIAIIRKSKTRDEAKSGLMARFKIDDVQAGAILDLRLSALVGLEISKIKKEKAEKEAESEIISSVLGSRTKLWNLVKKELLEIKQKYGDARKTKIAASAADEAEYSVEDFIEHERTHVIVSRDGWVRRVKNVTRPESLRFKQGDGLLSWLQVSTRDLICFFTSAGKVYGMRALGITQTTGFGDPVQSLFKFADKERIVAVMGVLREGEEEGGNAEPESTKGQKGLFDRLREGAVESVYGEKIGEGTELLVVTENGMGFRFSGDTLGETNRNGRKLATVKGDDAIMEVLVVRRPMLFTLSSDGRGLLSDVKDISFLNGPGAGVRLMKLKPGSFLMGARNVGKKDKITLTYMSGRDDALKVAEMEKGARGSVGRVVAARRKKLAGMGRLSA